MMLQSAPCVLMGFDEDIGMLLMHYAAVTHLSAISQKPVCSTRLRHLSPTCSEITENCRIINTR